MKFYFSLFLILSFVFMALLAPILAPFDPLDMNISKTLLGPSFQHFFGLDENGSDVFSKLLLGSRITLSIAFLSLIISLFIGLLIGSFSAWKGGFVDFVVVRFIDMFYAFPNFLIALSLIAFLGPSVQNMILAMSLTTWTGFARLVRAEVLHLKQTEYVLSAQSLGVPSYQILFKHIWPNLFSILLVQSTLTLSSLVIVESGLNFLGLGLSLDTPTWGFVLNSGRRFLLEAPHISFFSALFLFFLILGFNFLGESLQYKLKLKKHFQTIS